MRCVHNVPFVTERCCPLKDQLTPQLKAPKKLYRRIAQVPHDYNRAESVAAACIIRHVILDDFFQIFVYIPSLFCRKGLTDTLRQFNYV
jgi:hypothetical protein